ncbi:class I SAM-dependent methyltransferase [Actinopolymorpha sp. NPDC004070]|uniref:class I SAM-dependent methyltransferase n=1 Tax=Actinopolymorpha sp. NPDC004070 TaxID=3154548 RepID=UPI0033BDFDE7
MTSDWLGYLDDFHVRHAGVTEELLRRCHAGDLTPYGWVLRPVAGRGRRVLDVACGSGAVAGDLHLEQFHREGIEDPLVVGIDRSRRELETARERHHAQVLCADATRLPFTEGGFDAVVCSMGLMVVQPVAEALAEIARVLRPGGMLSATVPAAVPLRPSDLLVLGPLTARLRMPPRFPGWAELGDLGDRLEEAGLHVVEDARERFVFSVRDAADAELLITALYLPELSEDRRAAAIGWLTERAQGRPDGVDIAIPIRRVLAMRR